MLDISSFKYALQYFAENDSCGTFLRVLAVTTAVNCDPELSGDRHCCSGQHTQHTSPPMGPKARGLAQHGGPPGWLEDSNPAGAILCVMEGPYRTGCPDRSCPAASWWNFQLLLYSKCPKPSTMSYVPQGRYGWYSSWPVTSLCSSPPHPPPPPKPTHRMSYPPLIEACSPTPTFRSKIPKCFILKKDALRRNTGFMVCYGA